MFSQASVIQSVHRGRAVLWCYFLFCHGYHLPLNSTPPRTAHTPSQQAGGTHRTRMLSCIKCFRLQFSKINMKINFTAKIDFLWNLNLHQETILTFLCYKRYQSKIGRLFRTLSVQKFWVACQTDNLGKSCLRCFFPLMCRKHVFCE